jgi:thymidylate synthase
MCRGKPAIREHRRSDGCMGAAFGCEVELHKTGADQLYKIILEKLKRNTCRREDEQ